MVTVTTSGRPLLLFSANDTDKEWRLKEKIVAVIESYLQPVSDPYTFSSINLPNAIESTEQVDVVHSITDDPRSAFSFAEVRDQGRKVGRPYIQQVMGKIRTLGVEQCTVASTRGFSRDAIRLATREGINVRALVKSAPDQEPWFAANAFTVRNRYARLDHATVLTSLDNKVRKVEVDGHGTLYAIGNQRDAFRPVPISRVLDADVLEKPGTREDVWSKVTDDKGAERFNIGVTYEKPRLLVHLEGALRPVGGIMFFAEIGIATSDAPISEAFRYVDATNEALIARLVLARFTLDGAEHYICRVRHSFVGEQCKEGGALFR